jgi:hypothetical protein
MHQHGHMSYRLHCKSKSDIHRVDSESIQQLWRRRKCGRPWWKRRSFFGIIAVCQVHLRPESQIHYCIRKLKATGFQGIHPCARWSPFLKSVLVPTTVLGLGRCVCTAPHLHDSSSNSSTVPDAPDYFAGVSLLVIFREIGGQELIGGVRSRRGSPPANIYLNPTEKLLPALSNFEKKLALAFLKATWLQISYWVHFTFKVSNPIYMCTST